MSTSPAFGLRSAASARARPSGYSSRSDEILLAGAARDHLAVLEEERDVDRRLAVERRRERARVVAVEHRRAVRGGDERAVDDELRRPLDVRLPVVGAEHDRVPLEELVRPARRVEERRDRRVRAAERLVRGVGPERVRGVVVVREVEDEQVEAVRA